MNDGSAVVLVIADSPTHRNVSNVVDPVVLKVMTVAMVVATAVATVIKNNHTRRAGRSEVAHALGCRMVVYAVMMSNTIVSACCTSASGNTKTVVIA